MKLKTIVTGLTLATAAAVVAVPSQAKVTYSGDSDSVAVCRAIMNDSGTELRQALRAAAPRHQKTLPVASLQGNYECNGQALDDFAMTKGSYNALGVLATDAKAPVAVR